MGRQEHKAAGQKRMFCWDLWLIYRGSDTRDARSTVLALTLPDPSRRIRIAAGPSGTPVLPQRRALTGWTRQRWASLAKVMPSLPRMRRSSAGNIAGIRV